MMYNKQKKSKKKSILKYTRGQEYGRLQKKIRNICRNQPLLCNVNPVTFRDIFSAEIVNF